MRSRIFLTLLAMVVCLASCERVDERGALADNARMVEVIEGTNGADTRTSFGVPQADAIPFYWSSGDYVWLGENKSLPIATDCSLAQFRFEDGVGIVGTGHIFYNMTGVAKGAKVLAEQTADGNLGNDGDFGYATLDEYNSFYLEHKTAYLWFDTTSADSDMPALVSITLDADGALVAGECNYEFSVGEWSSEVANGSDTITLSFGDGVALQEANEGVMAAMVLLPADIEGKNLQFTYCFADGSTFTESKTPQKSLVAGATMRVATTIAKADLVEKPKYELRVLSFDDGTERFEPYTITGYDASTSSYYDHTVTSWSDLIDTPEYGGPLTYGDMGYSGEMRGCDYHWYDEGNTYLASEFPVNYGSQVYWGGGHVVSNYASTDYATYGTYEHQMTVYGPEGAGGRNGSANFGIHYGYIDGSEYNMTEVLPYFYFADGEARVIDHMWVNNSCYAISCYADGNGLTENIGENDYVKLVATGYDAEGNTTTSEFYLCNGPEHFVMEWAKWDLSELGKVIMVEFNILGSSDNGYGFSQPSYFAYDDVTVRFE